ncbi:MAG: hypothetical protein ACSLEL_05210 [Candidatus Malihini olakiniferum]
MAVLIDGCFHESGLKTRIEWKVLGNTTVKRILGVDHATIPQVVTCSENDSSIKFSPTYFTTDAALGRTGFGTG